MNELDKIRPHMHGMNILLQGLHGTGKTAMVSKYCDDNNLRLHTLNGATIDPYLHLVGIPNTASDELRLVRPHHIDNADVLFLDELNRSPVEVQNALLEIINNRSINGEKLPNLKCVIAAINPPDDKYSVRKMDEAMMDRFHMTLEIKPSVSKDILVDYDKVLPETADVIHDWYEMADMETREHYVSPRKAAQMGRVWDAFHDADLLDACVAGRKVDTGFLLQLLSSGGSKENVL